MTRARGRAVWRSCGRKARYRSDYEAANAIAGARRAHDARERGAYLLRAYECEVCGGYHITKTREHVR
jgi:hypothetical protein